MARGNETIVKGGHGLKRTVHIASGETWKPGTVVQIDPTAAVNNPTGLHTAKLYNRDADGDRPAGPFLIVTNEHLKSVGGLQTDSYPVGDGKEVASVYAPQPGDELNLLVGDQAGTDVKAAGTILIVDDGTGKFISTSGTPETEPAMQLESFTNGADALTWCVWSGQ